MIEHNTRLLARATEGDDHAIRELTPCIYEELRRLAHCWLDRQPGGALIQPTALVHEAFLKLINADAVDHRSRTHFMAIASRAMRQVLIDHVRTQRREKRGRDWTRVTLSEASQDPQEQTVDAEALESALVELSELDERAGQIVVMRFFAGMTQREIALHLNISERTVRNDWHMARAWLKVHLKESQEDLPPRTG